MVRLILATVLVACTLSGVMGHGRLRFPYSRASMWRDGYDNPPNWTDHELYCGGIGTHWDQNGGKCGTCGDAWHLPQPRDHEGGGIYGRGLIPEPNVFTAGQVIDIVVEITANHNGYHRFRLCPHNSPLTPVTWECLEQHVLLRADGGGTDVPQSSIGWKTIPMRLPAGVTCSQCMLQWDWKCGNQYGCNEHGECCNGCTERQEHFMGCADITINP